MNLVEIKIISIPKKIYDQDWSRFKVDMRNSRKIGNLVHVYIPPDGNTWLSCNCRYDTEEDIFRHGLECVQAFGQGIATQSADAIAYICPVELSFMIGWRMY